MSYAFIYWLLIFLGVLFWGFGSFYTPQGQTTIWWGRGQWLFPLILFILIGLRIFGLPIHE